MRTKYFILLLGIVILIPGRAALSQENTNLVSTAVPLVYKKDTIFYVLNGIDTLRKSEIWGFMLNPGIFLRKTEGGAGRWQDVESMNWFDCKVFAESMTFNGKTGRLPSKELLAKYKGQEKDAIDETVNILKQHGIDAFEYAGLCWCCEEDEKDPGYAYRFSLNIGELIADKYNTASRYRRIVIDFSY